MSWQVASFGLIAVVLAGGAVWYERSRPPARLVGLVAALAALAVAGRVALAPLPNVVATTDIALLTGFSLGAAPGFAVGALAGLVSNIWLGQGPWTPWQMAGWGLVGISGAVLARVTLHRAGRVILAVAAGLAGLAYGAFLDLSVMVTYGGEQSVDRYLALSARGIPFNLAHALGNFAIIWAAGPAIVRMLERFRVRSRFFWHPVPSQTSRGAGSVGISGAIAGLVAVLALLPAVASAGPASTATSWLQSQQNDDGGWGNAPDAQSSPAMTAWAMLGLEATGDYPGGAVAYLRERSRQVRSATDLERTILALEGAGVDSRAFAGRDLVAELVKDRSRDGSWKGGVNPTAFGVLALESAGDGAQARRSISWLEVAQNHDGGWGFNRGVASDPDSTGAALQALAAAGAAGSAVREGARHLRRVQHGDGGFPAQPGLTSNSQSTAWALQGLVAAGVDPARVRKRRASPIDFLRRRQAGDGHVAYSRQSDQTPVWVTAQAVMGLEGVALPAARVAPHHRPEAETEPEPSVVPVDGGGGENGKAPAAPQRKQTREGKESSARSGRSKRRGRAQRESLTGEDVRKERVVVNGTDRGATRYAPLEEVGGDDDDDGMPVIAWIGIAAAALAAAGAGLRLSRRHG